MFKSYHSSGSSLSPWKEPLDLPGFLLIIEQVEFFGCLPSAPQAGHTFFWPFVGLPLCPALLSGFLLLNVELELLLFLKVLVLLLLGQLGAIWPAYPHLKQVYLLFGGGFELVVLNIFELLPLPGQLLAKWPGWLQLKQTNPVLFEGKFELCSLEWFYPRLFLGWLKFERL